MTNAAPSPDSHFRVAILGSGPAGLTAALYAARAGLEPVIFEGNQPGGQLTITTEVENYPGFVHGIQGPELIDQMREQARRFGAQAKFELVTEVDFSQRPFRFRSDDKSYSADALILSTGASAKLLGLPSERELMGYGVSACATCDGFFFKGKEVVDILGSRDAGVSGLRLRDRTTGAESVFATEGLFVAIGHQPNTQVFGGQLATNAAGYLLVEEPTTRTAISGVFACGDVTDPLYRQAVTAAGSGCKAAIDAERWLEAQHG